MLLGWLSSVDSLNQKPCMCCFDPITLELPTDQKNVFMTDDVFAQHGYTYGHLLVSAEQIAINSTATLASYK